MRIKKVLVTNDDGYNSFGIKLLSDILKNFTHEIYVVAPKKNMSGSSRSISLKEEIKNLNQNPKWNLRSRQLDTNNKDEINGEKSV